MEVFALNYASPEVPKGITGGNLRTSKKAMIRMSIISIPIPDMEASVFEQAAPIVTVPVLTANEVSGYRTCTSKEDAIRKRIAAISENAQNRILMSQELSIYANSEYVYAIFSIAIALFLDKGSRVNCRVGAIVYDFHDSNALFEQNGSSNYYVRAKGRWFCEDTCLSGSSAISPLGNWERSRIGPNPRNVAGVVPKTFYRSFSSLVLATLRFGKMSRGATEGREKLPSLENLSIELSKKGCETVDLSDAFVKLVGSAMDLSNRLSPEFDLKSELLSGRAKALAKTDFAAYRDSMTSGRTSRFYNWRPKQMIGNYENRVFAQPVRDWSLVSVRGLYDNLDSLMEMGMVTSCWGDPPHQGGPVYKWFYLGLEQSEFQRLAIPTSHQEELPPASSRD